MERNKRFECFGSMHTALDVAKYWYSSQQWRWRIAVEAQRVKIFRAWANELTLLGTYHVSPWIFLLVGL